MTELPRKWAAEPGERGGWMGLSGRPADAHTVHTPKHSQPHVCAHTVHAYKSTYPHTHVLTPVHSPCTHAHKYTRDACTLQVHSHTLNHTLICTLKCLCTHTHTNIHVHALLAHSHKAHAHIINTATQAPTSVSSHSLTLTPAHKCKHPRAHIHTCVLACSLLH